MWRNETYCGAMHACMHVCKVCVCVFIQILPKIMFDNSIVCIVIIPHRIIEDKCILNDIIYSIKVISEYCNGIISGFIFCIEMDHWICILGTFQWWFICIYVYTPMNYIKFLSIIRRNQFLFVGVWHFKFDALLRMMIDW